MPKSEVQTIEEFKASTLYFNQSGEVGIPVTLSMQDIEFLLKRVDKYPNGAGMTRYPESIRLLGVKKALLEAKSDLREINRDWRD